MYLYMSKIQILSKVCKRSKFIQNLKEEKINILFQQCSSVRFAILIILSLTRSLQFTPLQNPGGVA